MVFQVVIEVQANAPTRGRKVSSSANEVEVRLDLSEDDLRTAFVEKYANGDTIIINGRSISPTQIVRFQVWQNHNSAEQVRAAYNQRMEQWAREGVLSLSSISDQGIAQSGTDVTDKYVKGPPGYARTQVLAGGALKTSEGARSQSREVFLVHGHDEGARESVARFLERLGLKVVILHEQASQGRTIIEKFEAHSDIAFAVVLLTPDDQGGVASAEATSFRPRARQNVIFELGFFIGRLGRSRVCALHKTGVELPSDFSGVVYIPMVADSWHLPLARELKQVIPQIDMNNAL